MDPISIICSSLAILKGISDAYSSIQRLVNLPKSFEEVNSQLGLAEELLGAAKAVIEHDPASGAAARRCLEDCNEKLKMLEKVFNELKDQAKKSGPATEGNKHEWATNLKDIYRKMLMSFKKAAKASKVENLMKHVMQKLQTLSDLSAFNMAQNWKDMGARLNGSIATLTWVVENDPSIKDEELPDHEDEHLQQNIHDHGTGYQNQNNNSGSGDMPIAQGGSHNVLGRGATINHTHVYPYAPAGKVRWTVPRRASKWFTGRNENIKQIQDALCKDRRLPTRQGLSMSCQQSERVVVVITGLGGIGKSELCLKISENMRQDFWAVFWVDVGSQETAKSDFKKVAQALGFGLPGESPVDQALLALANNEEHWLLILDNADLDFDCANYIPSGSYGAIIITSRNPNCKSHGTVNLVVLGTLELDHSKQLLLKTAEVPEDEWQSQETQAQKIVSLLGAHTLAVITAGAYIAEGQCTLRQYPKKFQRMRQKLLEYHPEQAKSRFGNVYATFEVSAVFLKNSNRQADQDALELLEVLCMLHSSMLRLSIFKYAWVGARAVFFLVESMEEDDLKIDLRKWHISCLPEFLNMKMINEDSMEWDDSRIRAAAARLTSLSLVTEHRLRNAIGLSMHSLTHAWAKDRLDLERRSKAWKTAGCVISLSRRSSKGEQWWAMRASELQPHMEAFWSPRVHETLSFNPPNAMLAILINYGLILHEMVEEKKLAELLQCIYHDFNIWPSEPSTMYEPIWKLAGRNMVSTGCLSDAVQLFEFIFRGKERTTRGLEKDHEQLELRHNLALAYRGLALKYSNQSHTDEAVRLLEHVVESYTKNWSTRFPSRLRSIHDLALLYGDDERIELATRLLKHVVDIRRVSLPEKHPHLLKSEHDLALSYWECGQIQDAIKLMEHVVKVRRISLPKEHADRLASEERLSHMQSNMVQEQGKFGSHLTRSIPEKHRQWWLSADFLDDAKHRDSAWRGSACSSDSASSLKSHDQSSS